MHDLDDVIGHAENVRVEGGALKATLVFAAPDVCELAEKTWKKVKAKLLRGISVGFRSRSYRWEMINEREVLVLSDNELFEISIVSIPANPDTLIEQRKKSFGGAHASAPALPPKENTEMKELELLAKRAGCSADVDSLLQYVERSAKFADAACSALGLAPTATPVDVVKCVSDLNSKLAEASKLAEQVPSLKSAVDLAAKEQADREVRWIVHCGIKGLFGVKADEKSEKSLRALRQVSPADFAEDFKVALDSLKAFDNLEDFQALTKDGGKLAEDREKAAPVDDESADEIDVQVKQIMKKNPKLSLTEALALVGREEI